MAEKRFKLIRDFLALAAGQVATKLVVFLAFAWLARKLEPSDYGFVELAVALATFASIVVDLGLGAIGARELARDPTSKDRLAATIPAAKLVLALVIVPLMGLAAFVMTPSVDARTLVWLYAISLLALPWKLDWLLQGLEMMKGVALGEVIRAIVFATGVFLCVHASSDLTRVGLIEICAAAAAAVFYLLFQRVRVGCLGLRLRWPELRGLFREASALGMSQVVWGVNHYVQVPMVAVIVGAEQTAWFGAPHRLVSSILLFSFVYHFNLFPALVRSTHASVQTFNQLVRASSRVVAWSGILIAFGITLLAGPVLVLLFGERFAAGAPILQILIWTFPVSLMSGHARQTLVARNRQRFLLFAHLSGMGVTLLATPLLIWQFQATGAAIGVVGANVAVWIAAHTFARSEKATIPFLRTVLRPAALVGLAMLACLALDSSIWMRIGVLAATLACMPLVDRELIPDLQRLANAKAYQGRGEGQSPAVEQSSSADGG